MFIYRAISFPLLLALLALIIYWAAVGPWILLVVAPVAVGIAIWEMASMAAKAGVKSFPRVSAVFGGALLFSYQLLMTIQMSGRRMFSTSDLQAAMWLVMVLILVIGVGGWLALLFSKRKAETFPRMIGSLGILLAVLFPLFFVAYVYYRPAVPFGPAPLSLGARNLLFLILVTKATDTGGYIFGMLSGRYLPGGNHKIVPSISPKKSWEGTIGGVLLSIVVSLIFYSIYADAPYAAGGYQMLGTSLSWYIVAGLVLALGSFAGDLTESVMKRVCEVKDSNHLIPGMGGVFDVLDSFLYNGILFCLLAQFRW